MKDRIYRELTSYYKHEEHFTTSLVLLLCLVFYWEVNYCLIDRNVPKILFIHVQYRSPHTTFFSLVFPCSLLFKMYYCMK